MNAPDHRQRAVEQQVWAIIRASGGWNARTRTRLARYSLAKRVERWRIAQAVRAVSGGAARAVAAQEGAPVQPAPSAQGGGQASVQGGSPGGVPTDARRKRSGGIAVAGACLLLGAAFSGALIWMAYQRVERLNQERAHAQQQAADADPGTTSPPAPATAVKKRDNPAPAPGPAGAADSSAAPQGAISGRSVPPAVAIFPQPPFLEGNLATPWVREALETLGALEAELERGAPLAQPPAASDRAQFLRATEAFMECWPVLESTRRIAVLDALQHWTRRLDPAARDEFQQTLAAVRAQADANVRTWWRGAGAAGLIQGVEAGGSGTNGAFAMGSLQWLAQRAAAVATASTTLPAGEAADLCDSWLAALDAAAACASAPDAWVARDGAVLQAMDALLRANAPLAQAGTPANAMGSLLDALPWTGARARRDRVIQAWRTWLDDAALPAAALHGATSVLSSHRPGPWWDPWMVVDARATMNERSAVANLLAQALAEEAESADAPTMGLRGIDPELVRQWRMARSALEQRAQPADESGRVGRCAEWMALVEAARAMERGRASDAKARLAQLQEPAGLLPDEADRWRDRKPAPEIRLPPVDGKLDGELRSRRSLEDRLTLLRALRTRPIHDLGPQDAETLAREALTAPSEQVRSVAQGVIADTFYGGPQVLAALVGEVHSALNAAEAAQLAAAVSGQPAPRGADAALKAGAALLLADRLASLYPSELNRLDAAARELALSATSAARLLGGDATPGMPAEAAMRAWARARADEARRTVPPATLEPMLARANARTQAAVGLPQRYVAEQTLLLELEAALLTGRMAGRRTEIQALVQRASAVRAQAKDVFAQIDANARALAELAAMSLGADSRGSA